MDFLERTLILLACVAIVAGVVVYVDQNVTCWKVPYVTSGCTTK